jgi:hypothetical protein
MDARISQPIFDQPQYNTNAVKAYMDVFRDTEEGKAKLLRILNAVAPIFNECYLDNCCGTDRMRALQFLTSEKLPEHQLKTLEQKLFSELSNSLRNPARPIDFESDTEDDLSDEELPEAGAASRKRSMPSEVSEGPSGKKRKSGLEKIFNSGHMMSGFNEETKKLLIEKKWVLLSQSEVARKLNEYHNLPDKLDNKTIGHAWSKSGAEGAIRMPWAYKAKKGLSPDEKLAALEKAKKYLGVN